MSRYIPENLPNDSMDNKLLISTILVGMIILGIFVCCFSKETNDGSNHKSNFNFYFTPLNPANPSNPSSPLHPLHKF